MRRPRSRAQWRRCSAAAPRSPGCRGAAMRLGRAVFALSLAALALASARCDGTTCIDRNPDVGALCLPAAVQADQTSVIEVRESCGLCSSQPQCDSTLIDGEVRVDIHAQLCNDRSGTCRTN